MSPPQGDLDDARSVCVRISGCAEPGYTAFNSNLAFATMRDGRPCFAGQGILLYFSDGFWRLARSDDLEYTGWNYSQAASSADPGLPPRGRWAAARSSPGEGKRDYTALTLGICGALGLPTGVSRDFGALLASGADSDVALHAGARVFAVHALVLKTRSAVFAAMLHSPMREASTRKIVVEDVGAGTVESLLRYVYTGSVPAQVMVDYEQVLPLMEAAHRYGFDDLCSGCAERLESLLEVENACDVLQAADVFGCDRLRQTSLEHIVKHLAEVQGTAGYERVAARQPTLLKYIIATMVPPGSRKRKADALCSCL